QRYEAHSVEVDRGALDWLIQIDGPLASGSVTVPYDFSADRPIELDMKTLVLPGDDTSDQTGAPDTDPRTLPAISLAAEEFAIGNRHFGNTSADFEKTTTGIYTSNLVATDPTFRIIGTAGWIAETSDPGQSQSYITATLESTDVLETMRRLDYELGIDSEDLGILLDIAWSGGPRLDIFETLNGEVQVRLGSGQLVEVEPGAGRVFGLISIVALPRRLSLDFRDVFDKGFGFDEIAGTFNISNGVATT
ncbi:MAG: AsmA-like C-terminal region-containing protein, partial [Pseudomonadota bacterium]